jgi:hypothetical protein
MNSLSVFSVQLPIHVSKTSKLAERRATSILLTFCLLCISATGLCQTQLGSDINGEAAGDQMGLSVSLSADGNRLAAGAALNDDHGTDSGHVRVYQWSETNWVQIGADIDGEATRDGSGGSVSLSFDGNRVAIGATGNDENGTGSGHVRVFQWSGTAWAQLGSDIDGEAAEDAFGFKVALSSDGSRLAASAPFNSGNGLGSGRVRTYQWSGTDWTQLGNNIDGEVARDWSGMALSLSPDGTRLAIGAPRNDGNGDNSGQVRVYEWSGSTWTQLGADIDGASAGDAFGSAVSLSYNGNRLAVGASGYDGNGIDYGQIRVFHWSGTTWIQLGAGIDGEAEQDYCCGAVSLSSNGNRLAIATAENDGNGDAAGQVRIFQWSGTAWEQIGTDIDGEAAGDYFGESVALSSDGNRVAAGARWNDGNGLSSGHVRVFDLSMFEMPNVFSINPGLNDAWYYPLTSGQGFFITVFPELGAVSLAWFTYDTELPPADAVANLGDPGHRWLTAVGPIDGNKAVMDIELTSGGIFDAASVIERTEPPGSDGTILLTFDSCSSGTIEYDIPSINRQGVVPIQRVANDNIALCEALSGN